MFISFYSQQNIKNHNIKLFGNKSFYNNVSFSANNTKLLKKELEILKNIPGIPCAYTGIKMVTNSEKTQLLEGISNLTGYALQNRLNQVMQAYNPFRIERRALKLMMQESPLHRDDNIQKLLARKFFQQEPMLIAQQKKIIQDARKIAQSLPEKQQVLDNLDLNLSLMKDRTFYKKDLIAFYNNLIKETPYPQSKEILIQIIEILREIPNSTNSILAFLSKYSKKTPEQIMTRILDPMALSIDHIKPSSNNGDDAISNFLFVARRSNMEKQEKPLITLINNSQNPKQFIRNLRSFINSNLYYIKYLITKKGFKTLKDYPEKAAATISLESQGLIIPKY
jgi:hypothetical protein